MNDFDYDFYVKEYQNKAINEGLAILEIAKKERKHFLDLFPVERIPTLSLDEFAFAKIGYGNRNSFCNLLYSGTEHIATRGSVAPTIYGLFYKDGNNLTLTDRYEKIFGDNKDVAFSLIKEEIYQLLKEIERDSYNIIEKLHITENFAYKILVVYFPDKFLPICTPGMMSEVCEAIELERTAGKVILFDNIKLRELKEKHFSTKDWDNQLFLDFCRWVGREKGNVKPASQRCKRNILRANKIEADIEALPLTGEEKKSSCQCQS